ncbi:MAG: hypothetical protein ACRDQD_11975, partial [Nocardioidaceae bacterium]
PGQHGPSHRFVTCLEPVNLSVEAGHVPVDSVFVGLLGCVLLVPGFRVPERAVRIFVRIFVGRGGRPAAELRGIPVIA